MAALESPFMYSEVVVMALPIAYAVVYWGTVVVAMRNQDEDDASRSIISSKVRSDSLEFLERSR